MQAQDGRSTLSAAALQRGAATWLATGISIEEMQISIAIDVRGLGCHPSDMQKLQVARRRDKLQQHIDRFLSAATNFLGSSFDSDDMTDPGLVDGLGEDDYSDIEDHVPSPSESPTDFKPECFILPLPSNLGTDKCKDLGLTNVINDEVALRVGQANDALHAIRVNLAYKAVIFRNSMRLAKSQAGTTRAWSQVRSVERVVSYNARIYSKCRQQLVKLGADKLLEKYQPLIKADLKASSAVADPNARGQRNSILPWFWTLDIQGDSTSSDWMTECKIRLLSAGRLLTNLLPCSLSHSLAPPQSPSTALG